MQPSHALTALLLGCVAVGQTPAMRPLFASDFGKWQVESQNGIPEAGAQVVELAGAEASAVGGQSLPVVTNGTPLLVDPGPRQEVVIPSSVNCSSGTVNCAFTASFQRPHPGHFLVMSGSSGLQEAINYAHSHHGGIVVLDSTWSGTDASIAAANGFADVLLKDTRIPLQWMSWSGGAYRTNWMLGTPGLGDSPPPLQYGNLTDAGPNWSTTTATADYSTTRSFQSAARFSVFANQGGTYGLIQPDYPIIDGEAIGRTQGQVGGLFTFNQGFGFSNVQGLNGVSECWGGAEPTAGGSYVQCSGMGEQDIVAPIQATVVRLTTPPAAGATLLAYEPVANEGVAGARQWFDVSQAETVGNAQPSGCGLGLVQGTAWNLVGNGCNASSSWVGKYLIPNTTAFWYPLANGACADSATDYTTDQQNCIGTPFLITSVTSASQLGTFASLDPQGLVDMNRYASVANGAVRANGNVTITLTAMPAWLAGTAVEISQCSDSSFDGSYTLSAAGAGAPTDVQIEYSQAGSDATASSCVAQHAPIPFIVVDGILASDVDITRHQLTLPSNSKAWAAGDLLVSPPTPWIWTVGLNLNIAKNYPAANMQPTLAPLGDGIRIRPVGPYPLTFGIEFYGVPPAGPGGVDTLIGVQPGFGPIARGLDVSADNVSDCVLCIGVSGDGHSNKIKFGPQGDGEAQVYFDSALELRGPPSQSVRIGDTAGLSAWTFSHAANTVTVNDAAGSQVLQDLAGRLQVGNAGAGVVLGSAAGTPILAHFSATGILSPAAPSTVPGCSPDLSIAVPGASVGDTVALGVPSSWLPGQIAQAWVVAADTVAVRICQFTGAAAPPTSGTYRVDDWRH